MSQFKFSEFDIVIEQQAFTGDKISVRTILNKPLTICQYKVEKSRYEGKGDCLYLQIEIDGKKHVVFTGGKVLIEQIRKVPEDKFPFTAIIVFKNERYEFT